MDESGRPTEPPKGCKPVFLQMRNMEKYGLKTGPTTRDVFPYKMFSRRGLLDEIQSLGVHCDFQPFLKDIEAYPEEELLVVGDPKQVYGDSWLLCCTVEAKEAQLQALRSKIDAEEAARRAVEEEEARKKAEEEARLNAVYEDKPIIARPYVSATEQETVQEVQLLTVKPKRELYGMTITRPRNSFRRPYVFGDRDTSYDGAIEFRSHKDPAFDLTRRQADIGLQAAPQSVTLATQTTWFRPVNQATQFESDATAVLAKEAAAAAHSTRFGDSDSMASSMSDKHSVGTVSSPITRSAGGAPPPAPDQALADLLRRARPVMEEALQQNETVNIFQDAFRLLGDEETHVGKKGENELKELRAFSSLSYSKNRPLLAVDWHPKKKGMIAVAPTRNLTFNQRIELDGMVSTSYVLVWDFVDFSSPQFVLQAPHEMFTFRFNPTRPNVVVAGSVTGQLLLWDITCALNAVAKRYHRSQRGGGRGSAADEDEEEDKTIPPVLPESLSHIESSHKRPVAEVLWLPANIQVNFRGQLLGEEYLDGLSHQFISIAGDGQVLIWDTRYEQIAEGHLPHIAKSRATGDRGGKDQHVRSHWMPLYRLQLKRPEGIGELSLCRVALAYGYTHVTGPTGEDDSSRSKLLLATEEGDLLCADWRARHNPASISMPPGVKDGEDAAETTSEANYVEWMRVDHPRPCVTLQKSPFFTDIYMTVGDWSFKLWKVDLQTAIFTSPNASTYITSGRWSVTRPGVVLIAKVDGSLDVWDFTDTSYKPSVTLMCGPSRITSMEYLRPNLNSSKQQLLAVGDANGNLHIFDMPRSLWKPLQNEKGIMRQFFDRELKKVEYVEKRMELRREEAEQMEKESEASTTGSGQQQQQQQSAKKAEPLSPASPTAAGGGDTRSIEAEDPEIAAMQAMFLDLEYKFVQDLGLTADDLPPGYVPPTKVETPKKKK